MGTYSEGNIWYCARLRGVEWADEDGRLLFDAVGGYRAPDLRERWEANGLEWDDDQFTYWKSEVA